MTPYLGLAEEVVRLYVDKEFSVRMISERTGLSYGTVRNRLIAAGVWIRPPSARPEQSPVHLDDAQLRGVLRRLADGEVVSRPFERAVCRQLHARTLAHAMILGLRQGLVTLYPTEGATE